MDVPMGVLLHDEDFLPAATELISMAVKSVYISSFKLEITTKPRGRKLARLFDLLAEKARDRVTIKILTNKQNNQGHVPSTNAYAIQYLKRKNIKVRCLKNNRICHAKIIIVDAETAIVGSHNLSVKSCHNNFELSYAIANNALCLSIAHRFLDNWYAAQEV